MDFGGSGPTLEQKFACFERFRMDLGCQVVAYVFIDCIAFGLKTTVAAMTQINCKNHPKLAPIPIYGLVGMRGV